MDFFVGQELFPSPFFYYGRRIFLLSIASAILINQLFQRRKIIMGMIETFVLYSQILLRKIGEIKRFHKFFDENQSRVGGKISTCV